MESLVQNKDCNEEKTEGFIYILSNPSMLGWIKIGLTTDLKGRLNHLNNKSAVPLSFYKEAIYKVVADKDNIEKELKMIETYLHNLIETIDPESRAIETNEQGKERVREFFAFDAEQACEELKKIAILRGDEEYNFKRFKKTEAIKAEERQAEAIRRKRESTKPWSFKEYGIAIGEKLNFIKDDSIVVTVTGEREVEYQGERCSISAAALKIAKIKLNWKADTIQGPAYFMYNGKTLVEIKEKILQQKAELEEENL